MSVFEAIFLGVVQGLTEFLPVSSSGHLVLFRQVFGVQAPPLLFDTMVHVGTLIAVFAVLRHDILALLKKIRQPLTLYLIIGTIPAVAAALLFRGWLEMAFETGRYIGFAFLATAALLSAAELLSKRAARRRLGGLAGLAEQRRPDGQSELAEQRELGGQGSRAGALALADAGLAAGGAERRDPGRLGWLDALVIGLCQALAVIPGISRSGATLSGALSRGLDRGLAARFSFMLSIPVILAAALFQAVEMIGGGLATALHYEMLLCPCCRVDALLAGAAADMPAALAAAPAAAASVAVGGGADSIGALAIAAGTVTAAVVGFFAVRIMLKIVREKSLWGFAIYTGILGLLVLIDQFLLNLVF